MEEKGDDDRAGGPCDGADPVGGDEQGMSHGVKTLGEAFMLGGLREEGAEPDDGDQNEAGPGDPRFNAGWALPCDQDSGAGFKGHGGEDDIGGELLVLFFVVGELVSADGGEEGVVDDLGEPDQAGHEPGGGGVDDEEPETHLWKPHVRGGVLTG